MQRGTSRVRVGGGDGSRGTIPKLFHATLAAAAAPRNGLAAVESGDRWEVRRPVGRLPLGVARLLTRTGVATGCYSGKICGPATLLIGIILVASYSPSSSTRYYTCRVYTPSHSWRRTCSRPRRRYPHRHHTRRIVQIPTNSIRLRAVLNNVPKLADQLAAGVLTAPLASSFSMSCPIHIAPVYWSHVLVPLSLARMGTNTSWLR